MAEKLECFLKLLLIFNWVLNGGGQYSIKLQRINEILCCVHVMLLLFSLPPPFHFTLYYYVGHFLPPLSRNWAHPQVAFFASILKPYSQYHPRNLFVDFQIEKCIPFDTFTTNIFNSLNTEFLKSFDQSLNFKNKGWTSAWNSIRFLFLWIDFWDCTLLTLFEATKNHKMAS